MFSLRFDAPRRVSLTTRISTTLAALLLSCLGAPADALPDSLSLTVDAEGQSHQLSLYRRSVRTSDYKLKLWNSTHSYFEVDPADLPEVRTYRGTVTGSPNTIVVGAIYPDGTADFAALEGKSYKWRLQKKSIASQLPARAMRALAQEGNTDDDDEETETPSILHVFDPPPELVSPEKRKGPPKKEEDDTEPCTRRKVQCQRGADEDGEEKDRKPNYGEGQNNGQNIGNNGKGQFKGQKNLRALHPQRFLVPQPLPTLFPPSGGMKEAELVFDITDWKFRNKYFSDIEHAVAEVEYLANVHDHFMARDAMIAIVVPQVVIRLEEFYTPTGMGNHLKAIATEWKGPDLMDTRWDMIHSFKTSAGLFGAGGYAYSNQIGKDEASSTVEALFHEQGHNWGASHLIYGKGTMDGNRPYHGPVNIEKVLNKRQHEMAELTFDDVMNYPDPLHPYSHVDLASTLVNTPVSIDVLANDWDANGDSISIKTFTTQTVNGGSVSVQNSLLTYNPPMDYVGKDIIYYEVQDSTGLFSKELVHIEVINRDLALQYTFDDASMGFASDSSGHGHHGSYGGHPMGGVHGSGIHVMGGLICDSRNLMPIPLSDDVDDYPLDKKGQAFGNGLDPMDESYTLDFWFRADNVTATDNGGVVELANKEFHSEQKYGFRIWIEDGIVNYSLREFSGLVGKLHRSVGTALSGIWHHLAFVLDRDADLVKFYYDGNLVDLANLEPGSFLFMGRRPLKLGGVSGAGLTLDDVRVHTRAFSSTEVRQSVMLTGKPVPEMHLLEAEDALFGGAKFGNNKAGYTGTGFVDYTASGSTAFVEWTVFVAEAGEYEISLKYALYSGDRPLDVSVNGNVVSTVNTPSSGSWKNWKSTSPILVVLNGGTNKVRASATGSSGPNVDHLLVEQILTSNTPPRFVSNLILKAAVPNRPISGTLAGDAFDFDQPNSLLFEKLIGGPGWLSVAADGTLSGTPSESNIGENLFEVQVTDLDGSSHTAGLVVDVQPLPEGIVDIPAHGPIQSYAGGQDEEGITTVEDYGATLHLVGNVWKAIMFPYTLRENSVLEFDFQSGIQGEEHSIGLDNNLSKSNAKRFKLYGTDDNGSIMDYNNYENSAPITKHYIIPVGQYYTGSMNYLFFTNDHDVSNPTGESRFSNIKVYDMTLAPSLNPSGTPTLAPSVNPSSTLAPTSYSLELNDPALDCSSSSKCGLCRGDCDHDGHCEDGLVCFDRSGTTPVPGCSGLGQSSKDYCYDVNLAQSNHLRYINETGPHGDCEGDCDHDGHCKEGFVCFDRSGTTPVPGCSGLGHSSKDYCYNVNLAPSNQLRYVDESGPHGECEGDCDGASTCVVGLQCAERGGTEDVPGCTGLGKNGKDYCYDPSKCNESGKKCSSYTAALCCSGVCSAGRCD